MSLDPKFPPPAPPVQHPPCEGLDGCCRFPTGHAGACETPLPRIPGRRQSALQTAARIFTGTGASVAEVTACADGLLAWLEGRDQFDNQADDGPTEGDTA